jgi:hypothetical protein
MSFLGRDEILHSYAKKNRKRSFVCADIWREPGVHPCGHVGGRRNGPRICVRTRARARACGAKDSRVRPRVRVCPCVRVRWCIR